MAKNILVVGHADGDGHVIAEQTRQNLARVPGFNVSVLVDPKRTEGHRAWLRLNDLVEADGADFVFFVDMMFSPTSFVEESSAFAAFATSRPATRFFVIDHHPLPLARLSGPNVRVAYRPDVFECTVGLRSGLMILAALCENQYETISEVLTCRYEDLAMGLKRAAAPGSALPGAALMRLLASGRWDLIEKIALETNEYHKLVRGRRTTGSASSPALNNAVSTALTISRIDGEKDQPIVENIKGEQAMPYDVAREKYIVNEKQRAVNAPAGLTDLESLVTILEVAALSLTEEPGAQFSFDDLVSEARTIVGEGYAIENRDVEIVLDKAGFVTRQGKQYCLRF